MNDTVNATVVVGDTINATVDNTVENYTVTVTTEQEVLNATIVPGTTGVAGYTPIKGVDYFDGINGTNGADGLTTSVNGVTQVAGAISLTQDNIPDGTTNKAYTTTEQTKLSGIATGAEVNVNADWNAVSGDAQISNKPTLGTSAAKNIPATGNASATEVVYGTDTRLTDSRIASDVSAWAKAGTKPTYTYLEVGAQPTGSYLVAADISGKANSGTNSDITSLTGLTTPLTVGQGGTGSATQNFVDLTTNQTIAGTKTFSGNVSFNAGAANTQRIYTNAAGTLYVNNGAANIIEIHPNAGYSMYLYSGNINLNANLIPLNNITFTNGTSTNYYLRSYSQAYYLNSTAILSGATAGQITITGHQVPVTDSLYTSGDSTHYWLAEYTDRLYLNSTAYLDGGTAGVLSVNVGATDATASTAMGFIYSGTLGKTVMQAQGFALGESAGAWNGNSTGTLSVRMNIAAMGTSSVYNGAYFYVYAYNKNAPTGVVNAVYAQTEGYAIGAGNTFGWVNAVAGQSGGTNPTGTITNSASFHAMFQGSGYVSMNSYGFYADSPTQGTNRYGLYLNNVAGGTLNYAIKTGLGLVSFGDVMLPVQAATASAPTYVKGGIYFDTTLNKLRIGGASAWETITSF